MLPPRTAPRGPTHTALYIYFPCRAGRIKQTHTDHSLLGVGFHGARSPEPRAGSGEALSAAPGLAARLPPAGRPSGAIPGQRYSQPSGAQALCAASEPNFPSSLSSSRSWGLHTYVKHCTPPRPGGTRSRNTGGGGGGLNWMESSHPRFPAWPQAWRKTGQASRLRGVLYIGARGWPCPCWWEGTDRLRVGSDGDGEKRGGLSHPSTGPSLALPSSS